MVKEVLLLIHVLGGTEVIEDLETSGLIPTSKAPLQELWSTMLELIIMVGTHSESVKPLKMGRGI